MVYKFEDKIDVIDREIAKRAYKWKLKAIPSIDYDDVSQLIRIHIYNKWAQWDQTRSLEPWLNVIISNQIFNMLRNLYGNYARPCVSGQSGKPCPANQGSNGDVGLCAIYGTQCSDCPLYAYWEKHKKSAHDTKLPLPLESHTQEIYSRFEDSADLVKRVQELHEKLKQELTTLQFTVYNNLFIEGRDEDEVCKMLGYKTTEANRAAGYRTIVNIKKVIIEKAKKILENDI